jgi:hypothetical protein
MKMGSRSKWANRLSMPARFLMIVVSSCVLPGCDTVSTAPGQGTSDGIQQIQTFFQDFAREILAAYLF